MDYNKAIEHTDNGYGFYTPQSLITEEGNQQLEFYFYDQRQPKIEPQTTCLVKYQPKHYIEVVQEQQQKNLTEDVKEQQQTKYLRKDVQEQQPKHLTEDVKEQQQTKHLIEVVKEQQQKKYLIKDVKKVCLQWMPEIKKKILELEKQVKQLKDDRIVMLKGNVGKFDQCLKEQEKSKQVFSETILKQLKPTKYGTMNKKKFYDYNGAKQYINRQLDKKFSKLNKETIGCKKQCQSVHICQKRIPEQISSIIQEIVQSQNLKKNILDSALEVEPFINECCKFNKKRNENVLQIKKLKQTLSSNLFQQFINFIDLLKEYTNQDQPKLNMLFKKLFDGSWNDKEKKEILEKFKINIKNVMEKRFPSVSAIKRNSKKIKKSK